MLASIKLNHAYAASLQRTIKYAMKLAINEDLSVSFEYNGVNIVVNPDDIMDSIAKTQYFESENCPQVHKNRVNEPQISTASIEFDNREVKI